MIEAQHLVKIFATHPVVDDLSLQVKRGEVLGFLGPNGAGKSTTMRMLTGFLAPDGGQIRVNGIDMARHSLAARAEIGYLPEGAPAWGDMTPLAFLCFIANIRNVGRNEIDAAIALTELDDVLMQPIETLSKGYRRRVGLAQAIIHNPPVLIMDEPTDGLDPNQKASIRRAIKDMAPDKAIIISTHILEEVDAVCSRALIIANGKTVAEGSPAELLARSRYAGAIRLSLGARDASAAQKILASIAASYEMQKRGNICDFTLFPKPHTPLMPAIEDALKKGKWKARALALESGRLDDVFRTLTRIDGASEQTHA